MPETAPPHSESPQLTEQHRELLDQVLDKWSLQVLDALCEGPLRFNGLRRAIPVVTQKSLTAALRRLERNGMVERIVTNTRPVAVEYRITPLGRSLQDLIDALLHWTTVTLPDVELARARFDAQARAEEQPSL
ncbi:helix-turn-helix transcriptional regulator [Saccharopolyspora erythraea]|uniref:winged helix-turn-helix transcriptional regulator n=1 Tax=Saccharopolyspora erythraea TaxID=1836 RepID=UPI001BABBC5C|nr:helix-turn-helix domain-containing protein [Saccharopolyspora erythraea]QUH05623.1 helix-turn-helix transcriptional regulator [Saccharopolyspora erythraea]